MGDLLISNKVALLFLAGAMALATYLGGALAAVGVFVVSMAWAILVSTYNNSETVARMYGVGALLALASVAWPWYVALLVVHTMLLLKPLNAFSWRAVMAMLLGFLTPFWLALPVGLYFYAMENADVLCVVSDYLKGFDTVLLDYSSLTPVTISLYALSVFLLVALLYRRSQGNYKGKANVRVQFNSYATLAWIFVVATPVIPSAAAFLLPLLIASIGPVAAQRMAGDGR